jgi:hypothetical protein
LDALRGIDWISFVLGTAATIVVGWAIYRIQKRDADIERVEIIRDISVAPKTMAAKHFKDYLETDLPTRLSELVASSLYKHLPSDTANAFARAWIERIAREVVADSQGGDERIVRLTRLFLEQTYIDCQLESDLEPTKWPRQQLDEHVKCLEDTLTKANRRLRDGERADPHEVATAFAFQRLEEATPPVGDYFEGLEEFGKRVGRNTSGPVDRFLSQVTIRSGFVAPLLLLGGLLNRVKEDWPRALAQFSDAVGHFPLSDADASQRPDWTLQHAQAFQFYCWLLWGPSIQLCKCNQWQKSGTLRGLQYGYGDESASLLLVFETGDLLEQSWQGIDSALKRAGRPYPLAVQTTLTATPIWGANYSAGRLPPVYGNEASGLSNPGLSLRCDKTVTGFQMTTVPYYSAYIWIMFEICDPAHRLSWAVEKWRRYYPVFEHTNIADGATYMLLKRQLAFKALATIREFGERLGRAGYPDVYFRYVCAVDDPGAGSGEHALVFHIEGAQDDRLAAILEKNAPPETLERLFELRKPNVRADLESSCHLPEVVNSFYATLVEK